MAENKSNVEKRPKIKTFYAANESLTVGALDISLDSKKGAVYLKFAPQIAYHDDRQAKGEYGWKESINVKLDVGEVGGIIRAIRTDNEFAFIHNFKGVKTFGSVKYYTAKDGTKGFGFSCKQGERVVKVPVPVGDAEFISEYLRFALDHIMSADYAADKKMFEAMAKKKQEVSTATPEPDAPMDDPEVPVEEQEPVIEDNPF